MVIVHHIMDCIVEMSYRSFLWIAMSILETGSIRGGDSKIAASIL